jgi:hypothetical protein
LGISNRAAENTNEIGTFVAWRTAKAGPKSGMPEDRKKPRFAVRPDGTGWTVFEMWTGEPVVLARDRQVGLSEVDAKHTADLMNRRALDGDRSFRH